MICSTLITSKRGFTLLELMIALAIVGITGWFAAHFLWSYASTYRLHSQTTDGKYLCGSLFREMEEELRYAKTFKAGEGGALRYYLVAEDGELSEHHCRAVYDSDTTAFLPEDHIIQVSYETDETNDTVVITMYVYKIESGEELEEPIYKQAATIRSFY